MTERTKDAPRYRGAIIAVEALMVLFSLWQAVGVALIEMDFPLYEFSPVLMAQGWAVGISLFLEMLIGIHATLFHVVSISTPIALAILLAARRRVVVWLFPVVLACWIVGGIGLILAAGFEASGETSEKAMANFILITGSLTWIAVGLFLVVLMKKHVLR